MLPILDIKEYSNDVKLLKCQNPTGEGTRLQIYRPNEVLSLTGELTTPVKLPANAGLSSGSVYWASWEDLLKRYDYLSLCWNPDIYPFS